MTIQSHEPDTARTEEFLGQVIGDFSGAMATVLAAVGDKLGLFTSLAEDGPATSSELAARTALDERYVREWLHGMLCAGYLEHDEDGDRFTLPAAHVPVVAQERGPMFLCGGFQEFLGVLGVVPQIEQAFRTGGGVPQSAYGPDLWEGLERFTAPWHEHRLVQEFLPAAPELRERLAAGCRYADVGCGAGAALIALARAFPASTFVGYDAFGPAIDQATAAAQAAGLADRVHFEQRDAVGGLGATYDVVSTFDVVHDAVDPLGLLRGLRTSLADDGLYLMLEINCAERPQDNAGPLGTLLYGFSVTYCMTTSLAHGGAGLGTCGMPPSKVRELCLEAGFSAVDRVPIDDPFNIVYLIRA